MIFYGVHVLRNVFLIFFLLMTSIILVACGKAHPHEITFEGWGEIKIGMDIGDVSHHMIEAIEGNARACAGIHHPKNQMPGYKNLNVVIDHEDTNKIGSMTIVPFVSNRVETEFGFNLDVDIDKAYEIVKSRGNYQATFIPYAEHYRGEVPRKLPQYGDELIIWKAGEVPTKPNQFGRGIRLISYSQDTRSFRKINIGRFYSNGNPLCKE